MNELKTLLKSLESVFWVNVTEAVERTIAEPTAAVLATVRNPEVAICN
jgi:hypothetical protein